MFQLQVLRLINFFKPFSLLSWQHSEIVFFDNPTSQNGTALHEFRLQPTPSSAPMRPSAPRSPCALWHRSPTSFLVAVKLAAKGGEKQEVHDSLVVAIVH